MSGAPDCGHRHAHGWDEPDEHTPFVDAALVRCCWAADAVATAYRSSRHDGTRLEVETAGGGFQWDIGSDGTWTFRSGSWTDEYGRLHTTTLLRPTLRGIARATRPDPEATLALVVRDVELAAGALVEVAEEHRRRPRREPVSRPTPEELLERTWPTLTPADRGTLWQLTHVVDVQAGVTLMVRDERGHDLLFLLDGILAVHTGKETVYLAPGSVVGERAAIGDGVRSATVETVTDALLLAASGHDLERLPEAVRAELHRKVLAP